MTTADLTALLTADLSDAANRAILSDALRDAGRDEEADLLRGDSLILAHDGRIVEAEVFTALLRSEDGGGETVEIIAADEDHATELAEEMTREWVAGGDWGSEGASISAYWSLRDECGDEVDSGSLSVEVEPDHEALIGRACGGRHDDRYERCCGTDPDDHDWTSEGEGGCDSNPGVWSHGGTAMSFASHCRVCGLHRVEHHTGSQRSAGEHDTVEYDMPDSWCAGCEREECECEVTCCVCGEDVPAVGGGVRMIATDHGPDHVCGGCKYEGDDNE